MLKNKKLLIILAAAVIIAAAVILIFVLPHDNAEVTPTDSPNASNSGTDSNGGEYAGADIYTDNSPITENTDTKKYPFAISGTNIEVLTYTSYDGVFIEDGTDTAINGVSTIIVRNTGKTAIELAEISASCNGKQLEFTCSSLPAGAMAVLQEKNRTPYSDGTLTNCTASVAELEELPMSADMISVTEGENNSLIIKNISGEAIPCVRVFYKFYANDEKAFVGGITYVAKLTDLQPGAEQTITPTHYADGYSTVTMVRTYDSAQ